MNSPIKIPSQPYTHPLCKSNCSFITQTSHTTDCISVAQQAHRQFSCLQQQEGRWTSEFFWPQDLPIHFLATLSLRGNDLCDGLPLAIDGRARHLSDIDALRLYEAFSLKRNLKSGVSLQSWDAKRDKCNYVLSYFRLLLCNKRWCDKHNLIYHFQTR